MNKEILKSILNTESVEFSYYEIQALLDEELEKSPEEMDTDLVELCIDALSKKFSLAEAGTEKTEQKTENVQNTQVKTHKKSSVKKIFLIAAIVVALSLISISVSANVFDIDLPAGMAKIFDDRIAFDLTMLKNTGSGKETDVCTLEDVCLPPCFYKENCNIETYIYDTIDNYCRLRFDFTDSEISGSLTARIFKDADFYLKSITLYVEVEQMKLITVNGIDIFICSTPDASVMVYYYKDSIVYSIDFENACFDDVVKLLEEN